jgi:hypothetical protein
MSIPRHGWFVEETQGAACACGTMKQHWINHASLPWPAMCAVAGCTEEAVSGVCASHATLAAVHVVPMCDACRSRGGSFNLRESAVLVAANLDCG